MFKTGFYAALVTPYTKDGLVDYKETKRIVRHLIKQGIEGLYVCGSTGEAFMLSPEERKRLLEAVIEENNGDTTVVCHCSAISTDQMTELARHAQKAGADAVSAIPPFYYKFNEDEILEHYLALADSVELPVIVYNYTELSGVHFSIELFEKMFNLRKNSFSIKHTSFDLYMLERLKNKYPNSVIFNGHDEICLSGLIAGADGAIGSTFNSIPKIFLKIRECYQKDDIKGAQHAQHDANDYVDICIKYGLIQVIKEFLSYYGLECNGTRRPFLPISTEGKAHVKEAFDKYQKIYS
jgi:N-acetylneuraminate lyase